MLIILVGTTLTIAKNTWEHFEKRGYSVITKYTYRPDDQTFSSINPPKLCTEQEVLQCDFKYEVHNGITGFNKSQIMDAVRGRCNALITMSPENLSFIYEIVASYGEYVIPVFLYIDEKSLEQLTRTHIKKEESVQMRLKTGKNLRKVYLENMSLFQKTVIFSTNAEFCMEDLYAQYDKIIDQAEVLQKKLNDRYYVDLPYKGSQDYVFVSYSHKDEQKVRPYLSALQRASYRIWYDEGIHKGENWSVFVGERIKECKDFLLFSSEHATASREVQWEISGARMRQDICPITVRLDDAEFPYGVEMMLKTYQNIFVCNGEGVEEIKSALSPSTKVTTPES